MRLASKRDVSAGAPAYHADRAQGTDRPVRRPTRLAAFDYRTPRAYCITFCTAWRLPLLRAVTADGRVHLTRAGRAVAAAWHTVLACYPGIRLLDGVIMPDHVHAIVGLRPSSASESGPDGPPAGGPYGFGGIDGGRTTGAVSLSRLVGLVKLHATRRINALEHRPRAVVWQRSFHDRILRTPHELAAAQRYIRDNPRRWAHRHTAQRP